MHLKPRTPRTRSQTPSIVEFSALTFEEQVQQLQAGAIADIKKYGGKPEKLIKDMPHRDYSRFEKKSRA